MHNEVFERARKARDPRFDGRFFIGVRTTGIYCRPICPAVPPKRENITFYPSAAAAGEAGLRPCLRCRPECAPGTPAWAGTSTTVRRGLRLIDHGALDSGDVEGLAARLGITSRHLRRLFTTHVGASPLAVAHTRRLHFAKRLIDDTALPMNHIAIAAGYGSVRRFNDAFRKTYGRAPRDLRRLQPQPTAALAALTVQLQYREPYSWSDVLSFYGLRATPGVEHIDDGRYRRTLAIGDNPALVDVRESSKPGKLLLTLIGVPAEHLFEVVQKTREVFDLDAPTHDIAETLAGDTRLRGLLKLHPGVRVPGAWNGFELAVRAVLGQQIAVRAATTLAGRIAVRYGTPLADPQPGLTHLFPTPAQLRRARFNNIGLVKSRAQTLRDLAAAVDDGAINFDPLQDEQEFCARLCTIRGIGDWTAQYILMRALKNPDALPSGDLGLVKALHPDRRATSAELQTHSEKWRPWRAYAAMLLWGAAPEDDTVYYCYLTTPIGELLLAGNDDGLGVIGFPQGKMRRDPEPDWIFSEQPFAEARRQLREYFDGKRQTFDLTLCPSGTEFQLAVLNELRKIPYGTTASYADIARRIGRPKAMRAVGAANGRNPLPVIIPCHRVIGSGGQLTGFGGGLPTKEALLRLEAEHSRFPHVAP